MYTGSSAIHNIGLFASRYYKAGDLIYVYNFDGARVIKYSDLTDHQISKNWYIDLDGIYCVTNDNPSEFNYINHSDTPNCSWAGSKIFADTNINKDEELTIDYRVQMPFFLLPAFIFI